MPAEPPANSRIDSTAVQPWLRTLLTASFLMTLTVGLLVPVYTDEIMWRLHNRGGIDGTDGMYNDLCGPGVWATPPWFMMPARWLSAHINLLLADPV